MAPERVMMTRVYLPITAVQPHSSLYKGAVRFRTAFVVHIAFGIRGMPPLPVSGWFADSLKSDNKGFKCKGSATHHMPFQGDAQIHWGPIGHIVLAVKSEMRGSTSFSPEIGNAQSHWGEVFLEAVNFWARLDTLMPHAHPVRRDSG